MYMLMHQASVLNKLLYTAKNSHVHNYLQKVPNYLRTKLDLDLEAEQRELKEAAKLMEKEGERENSKKKIAVFNETIQVEFAHSKL